MKRTNPKKAKLKCLKSFELNSKVVGLEKNKLIFEKDKKVDKDESRFNTTHSGLRK